LTIAEGRCAPLTIVCSGFPESQPTSKRAQIGQLVLHPQQIPSAWLRLRELQIKSIGEQIPIQAETHHPDAALAQDQLSPWNIHTPCLALHLRTSQQGSCFER
jgi:hypothetical protein